MKTQADGISPCAVEEKGSLILHSQQNSANVTRSWHKQNMYLMNPAPACGLATHGALWSGTTFTNMD